ncbi:hypothetical protein AX774_g278 [Zancudomyces culisetae]|uniref:Yeast cell wall synthesis Kre9/Knh1-like N-terminal domain-containing protein n=1 Tax=Zancudomyces culisetae TaxID=1213189 RepID=A0A1R1PZ06_ZANCU|nr:hypothetical protein AX774_g278 [Zancudomyces culisetae]|eukprot:OMH86164.1 hypothetical protein AX774_g278 [Zancudomyces culisetae]
MRSTKVNKMTKALFALLLLFVIKTFGTVIITNPVAGTKWVVGQIVQVAWMQSLPHVPLKGTCSINLRRGPNTAALGHAHYLGENINLADRTYSFVVPKLEPYEKYAVELIIHETNEVNYSHFFEILDLNIFPNIVIYSTSDIEHGIHTTSAYQITSTTSAVPFSSTKISDINDKVSQTYELVNNSLSEQEDTINITAENLSVTGSESTSTSSTSPASKTLPRGGLYLLVSVISLVYVHIV